MSQNGYGRPQGSSKLMGVEGSSGAWCSCLASAVGDGVSEDGAACRSGPRGAATSSGSALEASVLDEAVWTAGDAEGSEALAVVGCVVLGRKAGKIPALRAQIGTDEGLSNPPRWRDPERHDRVLIVPQDCRLRREVRA